MDEQLIAAINLLAKGQERIAVALERLADAQEAMFECQAAATRESREAMRRVGVQVYGGGDAGGS